MKTRHEILEYYRQNPGVSVLIIGAGINGIGTFRDLALQGIDTLIIDKDDFCAGSSAASSRQAHGGLRYLEHGDFGLVRESLAERNRLLRNAPHAVELLPTVIPLYSWLSGILNAPLKFLKLLKKPSRRGYVIVKLGLLLYDWFTRNDRMTPTHKMLGRKAALARYPGLNPNIIGAATYYDCLMPQAERIAVELVLDAEQESETAHGLNYCSIVSGSADCVELRDELTGQTFTVRPRLVVNASGAWIDVVNRKLNKPTRFIGGTKGSHIVIDHPLLAGILKGSVIYFETADHRTAIFMPLRDKVIIGATDIRCDDPDSAVCTEEEIDYFLSFSKYVLPDIQVDRSQIIFHFSGVRPLPASDVEFVGLVTRDHSIQVVEPDGSIKFPIYSLVGGKWTTYRAFAEQVTNKALDYLQKRRRQSTKNLSIGGGRGYPHEAAAREQWLDDQTRITGLGRERMLTLLERYGMRAEQVAQFTLAESDTPLEGLPQYSRREIMFLAMQEKVEHLDDILIRRSLIAMLGLLDGRSLQSLAAATAQALDWSREHTRQEIERSVKLLTINHGVSSERLAVPSQ